MVRRHERATEQRPLAVLGIGEQEESAYTWLVSHPGATVWDLASALEITQGKAQRLADSIEIKGLATHSPQRPRRYIPASPDIAMEALVVQRQNELQRARGAIKKLQSLAAALPSKREQENMVELIMSRETESQIFEQMQLVAKTEVLTFIRAPMRITQLGEAPSQRRSTQPDSRNKAVRFRSIVDIDYLNIAGAVDKTWRDMRAGEDVRVTPHLPFKMVISDRRIALIPLNLETSSSPALLVRSSALLDALHALFEVFWERAAPITIGKGNVLKTGAPIPRVPEDCEALLSLLAAGINDKRIVAELGISRSTFSRRIVEMMAALGARTRFQLGWLAARQWSA